MFLVQALKNDTGPGNKECILAQAVTNVILVQAKRNGTGLGNENMVVDWCRLLQNVFTLELLVSLDVRYQGTL